MAIRRCPTCGSRRIRRQTVTITVTVRGKKAEVPGLDLEICPDCGEKLFDLEASRRMEEQFLTRRRGRSAAIA
jgi:YgiT-type zinc finger domain-containing protein